MEVDIALLMQTFALAKLTFTIMFTTSLHFMCLTSNKYLCQVITFMFKLNYYFYYAYVCVSVLR